MEDKTEDAITAASVPKVGIMKINPNRPLAEIIQDLSKRVPEHLLSKVPHKWFEAQKEARDRENRECRKRHYPLDLLPYDVPHKYIPWYNAVRVLNHYAPGWIGEIRNISVPGKTANTFVTVVYRITVKGSDGEVCREASATSTMDYGDHSVYFSPVQNAEREAFCKACLLFGLGLYLYHSPDAPPSDYNSGRRRRSLSFDSIGSDYDVSTQDDTVSVESSSGKSSASAETSRRVRGVLSGLSEEAADGSDSEIRSEGFRSGRAKRRKLRHLESADNLEESEDDGSDEDGSGDEILNQLGNAQSNLHASPISSQVLPSTFSSPEASQMSFALALVPTETWGSSTLPRLTPSQVTNFVDHMAVISMGEKLSAHTKQYKKLRKQMVRSRRAKHDFRTSRKEEEVRVKDHRTDAWTSLTLTPKILSLEGYGITPSNLDTEPAVVGPPSELLAERAEAALTFDIDNEYLGGSRPKVRAVRQTRSHARCRQSLPVKEKGQKPTESRCAEISTSSSEASQTEPEASLSTSKVITSRRRKSKRVKDWELETGMLQSRESIFFDEVAFESAEESTLSSEVSDTEPEVTALGSKVVESRQERRMHLLEKVPLPENSVRGESRRDFAKDAGYHTAGDSTPSDTGVEPERGQGRQAPLTRAQREQQVQELVKATWPTTSVPLRNTSSSDDSFASSGLLTSAGEFLDVDSLKVVHGQSDLEVQQLEKVQLDKRGEITSDGSLTVVEGQSDIEVQQLENVQLEKRGEITSDGEHEFASVRRALSSRTSSLVYTNEESERTDVLVCTTEEIQHSGAPEEVQSRPPVQSRRRTRDQRTNVVHKKKRPPAVKVLSKQSSEEPESWQVDREIYTDIRSIGDHERTQVYEKESRKKGKKIPKNQGNSKESGSTRLIDGVSALHDSELVNSLWFTGEGTTERRTHSGPKGESLQLYADAESGRFGVLHRTDEKPLIMLEEVPKTIGEQLNNYEVDFAGASTSRESTSFHDVLDNLAETTQNSKLVQVSHPKVHVKVEGLKDRRRAGYGKAKATASDIGDGSEETLKSSRKFLEFHGKLQSGSSKTLLSTQKNEVQLHGKGLQERRERRQPKRGTTVTFDSGSRVESSLLNGPWETNRDSDKMGEVSGIETGTDQPFGLPETQTEDEDLTHPRNSTPRIETFGRYGSKASEKLHTTQLIEDEQREVQKGIEMSEISPGQRGKIQKKQRDEQKGSERSEMSGGQRGKVQKKRKKPPTDGAKIGGESQGSSETSEIYQDNMSQRHKEAEAKHLQEYGRDQSHRKRAQQKVTRTRAMRRGSRNVNEVPSSGDGHQAFAEKLQPSALQEKATSTDESRAPKLSTLFTDGHENHAVMDVIASSTLSELRGIVTTSHTATSVKSSQEKEGKFASENLQPGRHSLYVGGRGTAHADDLDSLNYSGKSYSENKTTRQSSKEIRKRKIKTAEDGLSANDSTSSREGSESDAGETSHDVKLVKSGQEKEGKVETLDSRRYFLEGRSFEDVASFYEGTQPIFRTEDCESELDAPREASKIANRSLNETTSPASSYPTVHEVQGTAPSNELTEETPPPSEVDADVHPPRLEVLESGGEKRMDMMEDNMDQTDIQNPDFERKIPHEETKSVEPKVDVTSDLMNKVGMEPISQKPDSESTVLQIKKKTSTFDDQTGSAFVSFSERSGTEAQVASQRTDVIERTKVEQYHSKNLVPARKGPGEKSNISEIEVYVTPETMKEVEEEQSNAQKLDSEREVRRLQRNIPMFKDQTKTSRIDDQTRSAAAGTFVSFSERFGTEAQVASQRTKVEQSDGEILVPARTVPGEKPNISEIQAYVTPETMNEVEEEQSDAQKLDSVREVRRIQRNILMFKDQTKTFGIDDQTRSAAAETFVSFNERFGTEAQVALQRTDVIERTKVEQSDGKVLVPARKVPVEKTNISEIQVYVTPEMMNDVEEEQSDAQKLDSEREVRRDRVQRNIPMFKDQTKTSGIDDQTRSAAAGTFVSFNERFGTEAQVASQRAKVEQSDGEILVPARTVPGEKTHISEIEVYVTPETMNEVEEEQSDSQKLDSEREVRRIRRNIHMSKDQTKTSGIDDQTRSAAAETFVSFNERSGTEAQVASQRTDVIERTKVEQSDGKVLVPAREEPGEKTHISEIEVYVTPETMNEVEEEQSDAQKLDSEREVRQIQKNIPMVKDQTKTSRSGIDDQTDVDETYVSSSEEFAKEASLMRTDVIESNRMEQPGANILFSERRTPHDTTTFRTKVDVTPERSTSSKLKVKVKQPDSSDRETSRVLESETEEARVAGTQIDLDTRAQASSSNFAGPKVKLTEPGGTDSEFGHEKESAWALDIVSANKLSSSSKRRTVDMVRLSSLEENVDGRQVAGSAVELETTASGPEFLGPTLHLPLQSLRSESNSEKEVSSVSTSSFYTPRGQPRPSDSSSPQVNNEAEASKVLEVPSAHVSSSGLKRSPAFSAKPLYSEVDIGGTQLTRCTMDTQLTDFGTAFTSGFVTPMTQFLLHESLSSESAQEKDASTVSSSSFVTPNEHFFEGLSSQTDLWENVYGLDESSSLKSDTTGWMTPASEVEIGEERVTTSSTADVESTSSSSKGPLPGNGSRKTVRMLEMSTETELSSSLKTSTCEESGFTSSTADVKPIDSLSTFSSEVATSGAKMSPPEAVPPEANGNNEVVGVSRMSIVDELSRSLKSSTVAKGEVTAESIPWTPRTSEVETDEGRGTISRVDVEIIASVSTPSPTFAGPGGKVRPPADPRNEPNPVFDPRIEPSPDSGQKRGVRVPEVLTPGDASSGPDNMTGRVTPRISRLETDAGELRGLPLDITSLALVSSSSKYFYDAKAKFSPAEIPGSGNYKEKTLTRISKATRRIHGTSSGLRNDMARPSNTRVDIDARQVRRSTMDMETATSATTSTSNIGVRPTRSTQDDEKTRRVPGTYAPSSTSRSTTARKIMPSTDVGFMRQSVMEVETSALSTTSTSQFLSPTAEARPRNIDRERTVARLSQLNIAHGASSVLKSSTPAVVEKIAGHIRRSTPDTKASGTVSETTTSSKFAGPRGRSGPKSVHERKVIRISQGPFLEGTSSSLSNYAGRVRARTPRVEADLVEQGKGCVDVSETFRSSIDDYDSYADPVTNLQQIAQVRKIVDLSSSEPINRDPTLDSRHVGDLDVRTAPAGVTLIPRFEAASGGLKSSTLGSDTHVHGVDVLDSGTEDDTVTAEVPGYKTHDNGVALSRSELETESRAPLVGVASGMVPRQTSDCGPSGLRKLTPLNLGLETAGGVMTVIIPRNTSVPLERRQLISTHIDDQTELLVHIFEGERLWVRDNDMLGSFEVNGIAPAPRGVPRITVRFNIDARGVLNVFLEGKNTIGRRTMKRLAISNVSDRPDKHKILEMIQDADKHKVEDEENRRTIELKDSLEDYVYKMRSLINDNRVTRLLDPVDKKQMMAAVHGALEWLRVSNWFLYNKKQIAEFREVDANRRDLQRICDPILERLFRDQGHVGKVGSPPPGTHRGD